jgi:hypothetical protein
MRPFTRVKALNKRDTHLWEEESGFLRFLSKLSKEVERFNETFGFDLKILPSTPETIDYKTDFIKEMGFLIIRDNPIMPERQYCLFSILKERILYGYIGYYKEGNIITLKEIGSITRFHNAEESLWAWIKALIKASCDKI